MRGPFYPPRYTPPETEEARTAREARRRTFAEACEYVDLGATNIRHLYTPRARFVVHLRGDETTTEARAWRRAPSRANRADGSSGRSPAPAGS